MNPVFCRAVRTTLSARVLDTGEPPSLLAGHVAGCLRCQAVTAQTLRLRRTLASLEHANGVDDPGRSSSGKWIVAGLASVAAAMVANRLRQATD